MKKLLNTLYVTSEKKYLSLDGENIVIVENGKEMARMPLHNLESIITFSYVGVSPALMGGCVQRNIAITFMTPSGRYLASVTGKTKGNVILRKTQYKISENEEVSTTIAKNFIVGKVFNCRWMLERAKRDHYLQIDVNRIQNASAQLKDALDNIRKCTNAQELRGREGAAATVYFSVFNELILQQKDTFFFKTRTRRPPLDKINALLSFTYSMLTSMVTSALEAVGLDPAVGFMHGIRPGRNSLALDMMEEMRPCLADRFVLTLVNKQIISEHDFLEKEDGAIILCDDARNKVLSEWQKRKQVQIIHPFLKEKISWGLVPHVQAMLMARFLRGDLDAYPPFFWK